MPKAKAKRRRAKNPPVQMVVPDPKDEAHVRRAFAEDEAHPERRVTVSPEELKIWAETGNWPVSSD
jgi:hypothetical protein